MSEAAKQESTASISGLRQPVTRQKTRETELKQDMRRIRKDLEKLDKSISDFTQLQIAHKNSETTREDMLKKLALAKTELIKILGLS